jgi:DNA polymerase III alpha subunit (gram-positive type)
MRLSLMRVLVFDTETGGLNPEQHSVFSLGALVGDLDSEEIIEKFEALHKLPSISDYVYTAKAVEIHGITPSQAFEEGLPTEEIRDKFMDLWQNHGAAIIGGHNITYDVNMLAYQIYHCKPQEFEANFTHRKLDTLPVIRLFTGHDNVQSGASLGQAIKLLNIDMTDFGKNKFHAALFDSICAFRLMCKFRKVLTQPDVIERLTS